MKRLASALALSFFVATTPALAAGDASGAAEDLFQRAKSLIAEKKWGEACPLLAESYRLDPAGGTLQNLAVCYESNGQWASAFARFQELKTLAKKATPARADRVKFADEHLTKITPKVAHLVIVSDETTAKVEIEGITYERASWSAGLALDPGAHEVKVTAAGKKDFKTSVTIPNEGTEQKLAVTLEPLPVEAPPPPAPPPPPPPKPVDEHPLRSVGFVLVGAGAVTLVGAGLFGLLTMRKAREGRDKCDGPADEQRNGEGVCFNGTELLGQANDAKKSASTLAVVTDVFAGVGVVAAGAGLYLAFVHRGSSGQTASLRIAPTLGGAMAVGSF